MHALAQVKSRPGRSNEAWRSLSSPGSSPDPREPLTEQDSVRTPACGRQLFLSSWRRVMAQHENQAVDVVLVGAGIMSATLAVLLKELDPSLRLELVEL